MTEFCGNPSLVLQASTMNGESDWSAAPTIAGQMKKTTQGNSHANGGFQWVFGMFDCLHYPDRRPRCLKSDASPILKMKNFTKSLARPSRWVRSPLPNEN